MEDQSARPALHEAAAPLCRSCNEQPALEGYPNPLCADCRQHFIRFPIPAWLWLFAGGIAALMIGSLIRMPKYLSTSMHLARAEKAMDERRYITAQHELEQVLRVFPHDVTANCRLLIVAARNFDMNRAAAAYGEVKDSKVDDDALIREVNDAMTFMQQAIPEDTSLATKAALVKNDPDALEAFYNEADSSGADKALAGYLAADHLYDLKHYDRSEAVLQKVLASAPENYPAQCLLMSVKREQGDYKGAMAICDHLLESNREDIKMIASKARLELKQKHDAAARQYARDAMALDSHDLMAMEAMAMTQYYEGHGAESRKLLAQIQAEELPTGDTTITHRLSGVLNGTTHFR